MPAERYSVVFVTSPSVKEAKDLARALLGAKLAACVNIIKGVHSLFWWQGKVDECQEALLVIKTKQEDFSRIRTLVERLHSYEVPEVISVSLKDIAPKYRRWLNANIRTSP